MSGLIGQEIGRYQITGLIGEGGMATVYKARDTHLDRDVAIKIIRRDVFPPDQLDTFLKRFEREAKLSHPNIIGVIDYGNYDGLPYLVMVYASGGTLKDKLGKPMPWREAVRLLIPVARALEYSHEHGIINRDIKPSNILLTEKGLPMLTDFGLAKMFENQGDTNLTATGTGLGTPDYMALEQWKGDATPQSDMYSLGVVLYEMITAHRPYVSKTPGELLIKQSNEPLPLPKQFVSDLPYKVEAVMLKVLAKDPANRYPDMRSFANELQDLLDGREVTATTIKIKKLREQMLGKAEETIARVEPVQPPQEPVKQIEEVLPQKSREPAGSRRKSSIPGLVFSILMLIVLCGLCGWFGLSNFERLTGRIFASPAAVLPTSTVEPPASPSPALPQPTDTIVPVETPIQEEITDEQNVPMRLIPGGEFTMGNDDDKTGGSPASSINVDTFYIDKFEVTNVMYSACVKAGACRTPRYPGSPTRSSYFNHPNFANYPVIYVDWRMAKTYCEWRGARLPTEAEWEKAARGSEDKRSQPWGNNFDCSYANHFGCVGDTVAVNQYDKGQSPYGVYGMSGNVLEWTNSLYSFYPYNATDGREDPDAPGKRVARGGSWDIFGSPGGTIRIDMRFKLDPVYYGAYVGIRCALTK